jgi:aspartyl-tRNA(Asn)/glutamyl-tRNA(Gln) amidotransferase subunit B
MKDYEIVIGLEVHAQLRTATKMFCTCKADYGDLPNRNTCPVCLGMPGTLPVVNRQAVVLALRAARALDCQVNPHSCFDRKNYFYPDLPKGYQITQFRKPICEHGHLTIALASGDDKRIGITRIHLEEDAGKDLHLEGLPESFVDFNRCGVPLIEIVSEPDLRSADEAVAYLKELRNVLRFLDVCDGNMDEGSFRCDANVSVMPRGSATYGTRAEVKNVNSFRFVAKAIEYEVKRQIELLEAGGKVVQETRLFDSREGVTRSMRGKEEAHDYRYFPEPDLLDLTDIEGLTAEAHQDFPLLPAQLRARFRDLGLPPYDAEVLSAEKELARWFLDLVAQVKNPKAASNWVMTEVLGYLNREKRTLAEFPMPQAELASLINAADEGKVSVTRAKEFFGRMLTEGLSAAKLLDEGGAQVNDQDQLLAVCREVAGGFPDELGRYLGGKEGLVAFFVGQVMKRTQGKANPRVLPDLMKQALEERRS